MKIGDVILLNKEYAPETDTKCRFYILVDINYKHMIIRDLESGNVYIIDTSFKHFYTVDLAQTRNYKINELL